MPIDSRAPICGVGAVIVNGGRVLLIRRGRPPQAGHWAIPGGKVRLGETMTAAVKREVMEETGLEVEVGDVVWAGESIGPGTPPEWHYCLVDFEARVVAGDEVHAADDALEVGWYTLDEARSLDLTGTMPMLLDVLADRSSPGPS
jgi:ADP-ribose pyrophosphatase YjhB (NUDIX family)